MTERPSAAELWPALPVAVREKLLAYGHKYWQQVYEDVALQNQNWIPLRSPVSTHAGYDEMNRITQRVSQLVLDACRRRARTAGELRKILEVPDDRIQLLDDSEPLTGRLINAIRSDLLLERGVPRMVECNVESALGGVLDADGVIKRWMDVYRDEPLFTAMDAAAPPSAIDARFDAIRADVGAGKVTAMLFTAGGGYPGADRPNYMINRLRPFADRGRELGVDLIVFPVEWVEQDAEGRLKAGEQTLDAVWRMFVPPFVNDSPGMQAVRDAHQAGTFRMYLPTAVWLLSNKTIFAWLWDDLDQLPEEDAEIVRAHIPRTWVYDASLRQRAIDERERLVFKPTDDYGGHGVFIGPLTSPEDWVAAIDAAEGPHIIQELIEADPLTMQFLKPETGEVVEAEVSYCVSTYLFDRIPAGVFTRFSPPGAGGVVNLTQGALTGGLLLVNLGGELMSYDWQSTSFDYWDELPQATKEKVLAAGSEDWKDVFSGILTFNKSWRPLRPVMIHHAKYDALAQVMDRLLGLLLETGQRRATTAGELRKLLGTPEGLIEYLDDEEVLGEQLIQSGRPDILISGGVPKFVEFNIGSEAGCVWDTERVSSRFLTVFSGHGLQTLDGVDGPVEVDAPPSPVDGRYQAIVDTLGLRPGDRLTTVLRTEGEYPGSGNLPAIVRSLDPFIERGKSFGLDGDVAPLLWLEADEDGELVNQGRRVDAVFRLFVCTDMPQIPGQAALKAAVESGKTKIFTSSAGWLLANKLVLAWLWDDLELLAPEDQELVRQHVPWSRVLTASMLDDAVARQASLVLKPADEYGGAGVLVGHETDPGAWREGLEEATGRGGFLLQDYVRPDRLSMDFVHVSSGEHLQAEVPYSVGPYTFGRKSFGCFLRVGCHEQGEVLNLKRAIHVTGPLLVTD